MNDKVLNKEVQDFINENLSVDIIELSFKGSPFKQVSTKELIQQIDGKKNAKKKLPTWFHSKNIYYPPKVNLEQTSSEITAKYKADLVNGDSIADITGGFGVDSYYFSKKINKVVHFEMNKELSFIAMHNFFQLNASIVCSSDNGIDGIHNQNFDTIFVDPSRRNELKGKVFYLKDCLPNVAEHLEYLMNRCQLLMIKTSPMLDISIGLKELKHVSEIHIVAIENEVKELLWLLKKSQTENIEIKTANLKKTEIEKYQTILIPKKETYVDAPEKYLYEPNAAIMKSAMFGALCVDFNLKKLSKSSHLFTSNKLIEFPGRRFLVKNMVPYSKPSVKKEFRNTQANISIRNFPEPVSSIKKKWNIKDGGDNYLFFTTLQNKSKVILDCKKI
ncbi:THUMP-like domain-containing protein [Planktosalinus lacus]|uniref:THUMP-like domain-containing protein n=1 Tax=Planktosalinus lacus TaxID=1526573 RepID=A0A8J2VB32_9FLAO|nr:class I SAM-dependent methyltransferase [Planktosalinus lacus]GGD94543.1 hypothetical protein GCM10011312_17820 [Planktosalinus lacus]